MIDFIKIWSALSTEERADACNAIYESFSDESLRGIDLAFSDYLAARLRMRPVQVRRFERERLVKELDRQLCVDRVAPVAIQYYAVVIMNEKPFLGVATDLLDSLGIPNEHGEPAGQSDYPACPAESKLRAVMLGLIDRHGARACWLHLSALRLIHHRGGCAPSWPLLYQIADELERALAEKQVLDKPRRAPAPPVEEPAPARLTKLDDLLIDVVVSAVRDDEGSISRAQLDDLIEEVLSMSATRHSSYFHRGFADAMFDRKVDFNRKEYSLERKSWYISGYFNALMRTNREEQIWDYLERPEVQRVLEEGGATSRSQMYYRVMRMSLRRKNPEWARRVLGWFKENEELPEPLVQLLEEKLVPLFAEGRSAEDTAFVASVLGAMPRSQMNFPLAVLHAQCKHALMEFEHAARMYGELLEQARNENWVRFISRIETALGLIELGRTDISELKWPEPEAAATLLEGLRKAAPRFEAAIACSDRSEGDSDGRAHYAMGLKLLLEDGAAADARRHLAHAVARFQEGFPYGSDWLKGMGNTLLAVAELEDLGENHVARAAVRLREWLPRVVGELPLALGQRLLRGCDLHQHPELARAVADALAHDEDTSRWIAVVCEGDALLRGSSDVRAWAVDTLANRRSLASPQERFRKLARVLTCALSARVGGGGASRVSEDEIGAIYDEMERLVARDNTWEDLLAFLDDESRWNEFLAWHEAAKTRARAFEARGRLGDACAVLQEIFFYALKHHGEEGVPEPEFLLSEIAEFGDPMGVLAELRAMVPKSDDVHAEGDDESDGAAELDSTLSLLAERMAGIDPKAPIRIVYIGGDERQAKHVPRIQAEVQKHWPGLDLRIYTPGWGSGWAKQFDRYENAIRAADAVVLSEYVRTTFGNNVRKLISKLDRYLVKSTGGGKNKILADIRRAARIAQGNAITNRRATDKKAA